MSHLQVPAAVVGAKQHVSNSQGQELEEAHHCMSMRFLGIHVLEVEVPGFLWAHEMVEEAGRG